MTDLTTTQSKPLAKTASDECSPGLWQRLTDQHGPAFEQATMELAHFHRSELQEVANRLAKHAEPCGGPAVMQALMPLISLYGVPDKSEAEWAAFWRFYLEALSDLPAAALKAGVAQYVARADSEFFPKPGPLRAICDALAVPVRMAESRARRALAITPEAAERYCR
jgi:hypothetical protein